MILTGAVSDLKWRLKVVHEQAVNIHSQSCAWTFQAILFQIYFMNNKIIY